MFRHRIRGKCLKLYCQGCVVVVVGVGVGDERVSVMPFTAGRCPTSIRRRMPIALTSTIRPVEEHVQQRSQCRAVALWVVLSYLHDVVDILPLLLITSPEGFGRYLLESLDHIIQEKRKKENLEPTEKIFFRNSDLCNELNQEQEVPWKDKQDGIDALVASQRRTARYCARHQILTSQ